MEQAADTHAWTETAVEPEPAARAPEVAGPRYVNRELSWLDFNEHVLELAEDPRVPLLERVKFLAIYTTNLDEFFMVRLAGLHDQLDAGVEARPQDGLSPRETIDAIASRVTELERRRAAEFERAIRPALAEAGIGIRYCEACDEAELHELDRIFRDEIFPVLTPL